MKRHDLLLVEELKDGKEKTLKNYLLFHIFVY